MLKRRCRPRLWFADLSLWRIVWFEIHFLSIGEPKWIPVLGSTHIVSVWKLIFWFITIFQHMHAFVHTLLKFCLSVCFSIFLIVGSWGAYCSVFCCCNFYIEITFLCYYSADYLYFFEYLMIRLLLFSDLNVEVRPTVNIPLVCSVLYVVYWSELSSWRLVGHQPSMRVVLPFLMWTYCVVGSCTSGATSTSASELFVACSQFTGVGWSHSSM